MSTYVQQLAVFNPTDLADSDAKEIAQVLACQRPCFKRLHTAKIRALTIANEMREDSEDLRPLRFLDWQMIRNSDGTLRYYEAYDGDTFTVFIVAGVEVE